jgi:hypothetical protein
MVWFAPDECRCQAATVVNPSGLWPGIRQKFVPVMEPVAKKGDLIVMYKHKRRQDLPNFSRKIAPCAR